MTASSTRDPHFIREVNRLLDRKGHILVVVRYVYGAGSKNLVLIESMQQFEALLEPLRARDSVVVMMSFDVVNEGAVDVDFIKASVAKYSSGSDWVIIGPDKHEYTNCWAYASSESELKEELESRIGKSVCIVSDPDYVSDESSIAAYVPDLDGVVRPGAY